MKIILSSVFALMLLVSGIAYSQQDGCPMRDNMQGGMMKDGHDGMGKGMGMMGGMGMVLQTMSPSHILRFQKDLNLTSDQVSSLQKIETDNRKDVIKRQAEIRTLRVDLDAALKKESPDFSAAQKLTKQISDALAQLQSAELTVAEKSYGVLNKDQKAKLAQLKPQKKGMPQENQEMK